MIEPDSKTILSPIRTMASIVSLSFGVYIFNDYITTGLGIFSIYFIPIFVISTLITVLIQPISEIKYVHEYLTSTVFQSVLLVLLFCGITMYHGFRSRSPILYSVKFYWEEGLFIDFRENGNFRARNEDFFSQWVSYGSYEIIDDKIVLLDEVKFGNSKMRDTLFIQESGIAFELESYHREVIEGIMHYYNNE